MNNIQIKTEFIKLAQFLKYCNAVSSGAEAKIFIQSGDVRVNGDICLQRGKKLYSGDVVNFEGVSYQITH